jgi:hypothetical protein
VVVVLQMVGSAVPEVLQKVAELYFVQARVACRMAEAADPMLRRYFPVENSAEISLSQAVADLLVWLVPPLVARFH